MKFLLKLYRRMTKADLRLKNRDELMNEISANNRIIKTAIDANKAGHMLERDSMFIKELSSENKAMMKEITDRLTNKKQIL